MPPFKLPLSGDVLNPWTAFTSPVMSQLRLLNATAGQSNAPAVEVVSAPQAWGRRLERGGDTRIMLAHVRPATPLSAGGDRGRRRSLTNAGSPP